ncbi:hypothetical protein BN2475_120238 [Paraburkholderia ribeironis]|uniref:Uncharacterized protein n=1 Tax=Paraburkholderia ribeironis TaxID=1247936 RepID=A0A1N7RS08_9BURK|nr:hypothetical protein BN2475_120238 [Paraburkholderia ribeironis]
MRRQVGQQTRRQHTKRQAKQRKTWSPATSQRRKNSLAVTGPAIRQPHRELGAGSHEQAAHAPAAARGGPGTQAFTILDSTIQRPVAPAMRDTPARHHRSESSPIQRAPRPITRRHCDDLQAWRSRPDHP